MGNTPATFADRLIALREAAGISQYRLAQLSGLTKQTVSRLEMGAAQPSWDTVQALGVSCEEVTTARPAGEVPPALPRGRPPSPHAPSGEKGRRIGTRPKKKT